MGEKTCSCCGAETREILGRYELPPKRLVSGVVQSIAYDLVECVKCQHVEAGEPPTSDEIHQYYTSDSFWKEQGASGDGLAKSWYDQVSGSSGLWERFNRAQNQLGVIRSALDLRLDSKIIDLGSGYSPFLFNCYQKGYRNLYALEPSLAVCNFLRQKGVVSFDMLLEQFVAEELDVKFDVMVISHTVEHLFNPSEVISGLRKHLTERGVIYIDVPFQDHLRPYHQGLHLQFFNQISISKLLENCDFSVSRIDIDHIKGLEKVIISGLYFLYGMFLKNSGGMPSSSRWVEMIHRHIWRPVKKLLDLKINIFISSSDLRVVAKKNTSEPKLSL